MHHDYTYTGSSGKKVSYSKLSSILRELLIAFHGTLVRLPKHMGFEAHSIDGSALC